MDFIQALQRVDRVLNTFQGSGKGEGGGGGGDDADDDHQGGRNANVSAAEADRDMHDALSTEPFLWDQEEHKGELGPEPCISPSSKVEQDPERAFARSFAEMVSALSMTTKKVR